MVHVTSALILGIAFLISFIITLILMPPVINICQKKKLYDIPDERKVHHNAIPRLGGSLFVPTMFISIAVAIPLYSKFNEFKFISTSSFILVIGIFIIYLVGLIDDLVNVKAKSKFIFQIISSACIPYCGLYINNFYGLFGIHEIPFIIGAPLTIFVFLLIVNAINLIDGIDGLASGLSIFSLSFFAILFIHDQASLVYVIMCLSLLGSVVAFFFYNMFGKAEKGKKIFMGDSGSLILGYILAFLSVKYAMINPLVKPLNDYSLTASITLMLIPTFDLVRVAFGRMIKGKPIFSADKTHLHHKLLSCGFSMKKTLCIIVVMYLFFCLTNYIFVRLYNNTTIIFISDILLFTVFILLIDRKAKKHKANVRGIMLQNDSSLKTVKDLY